MSGGEDCECRPLGFLIGLPFALICILLSILGAIVWVIGTVISCICPCCFCLPPLVNFALALIKAPFRVIKWFASKFPC
ncbi:hypothetical protein KP509_06G081200 [Ceratopteris richardii]|uniref:Transmembrane protein n=1 Tax=Ceratopteris richardii TaxID=49495 RepID=A0A8T2UM76_CERRI|nr:hypothetical protein KP509_06G081200 [Ceratopteris richardii]